MRPATTRSVLTRTVARPAIRLRKRSFRVSSNWSSGTPARSGGTIVCGVPGRPRCAGRRLPSGFARPVRRDGMRPVGARRDERSWHPDRHRRRALEQGRAGLRQVCSRRALRPAHRDAASGDQAQSIADRRSDGAPSRRPTWPRRRCVAGAVTQGVPICCHTARRPCGARGPPKFESLDRRERVLACVKLARRFGLDFLRARPDPGRHSSAGCPGDRSGTAASPTSFCAPANSTMCRSNSACANGR